MKNYIFKWEKSIEKIAGKDVIPCFHGWNPDISDEIYDNQRKMFEDDVRKKKTAITFKAGVDEYKDK